MKKIGTFNCCSEIKDGKRFCHINCQFFESGNRTKDCSLYLSTYDLYNYGTSYMFPSENCPACNKDSATVTLFSKEEE
jgi:hypothetical protein